MKKVVIALMFGLIALSFSLPAEAIIISFLAEDNFAGVDDPTGLSLDDTLVQNGVGSCLNGDISVGGSSHSGTYGLGVWGGGCDAEIDWSYLFDDDQDMYFGPREAINIHFYGDYDLVSFEVRSLYTDQTRPWPSWMEPSSNTFNEYGIAYADFENVDWNFSTYYDDYIVFGAVQSDGYGIRTVDTTNYFNETPTTRGPIRNLLFYFEQEPDLGNGYTLARIEVVPHCGVPIPEPGTLLLLGTGLMGIFARKKTKQFP